MLTLGAQSQTGSSTAKSLPWKIHGGPWWKKCLPIQRLHQSMPMRVKNKVSRCQGQTGHTGVGAVQVTRADIKCLLCKSSLYTDSYPLHNSSLPLYRWRNWVSERWRDFLEVAELGSGSDVIWTPAMPKLLGQGPCTEITSGNVCGFFCLFFFWFLGVGGL